jgi:hypothetical protein
MNLRTIAVAAALTTCSPLTVFAQALMGAAMSTPPLPTRVWLQLRSCLPSSLSPPALTKTEQYTQKVVCEAALITRR